MKLLHLYKDYSPVVGGIENHIKLLAEAQAADGHEVTVLVTSVGRRTEHYRQNGVTIIKAARLAHLARTPLSLDLLRRLAALRADILHCHFPYPMGEVAALLRNPARATVVSYHSDVVRQATLLKFYRPLMHRFLDRAERIIATSAPYVESSPVLQRFRAKVRVVPLGIDTAAFATADATQVAALQQRYSRAGEPLILFIGKLRYYKGVELLLRAAVELTGGRVLIVGDGPEEATLHKLHRELALDERVRFLGRLPDERLIALRHATRQSGGLFVLPATHRSEAFGLVLAEAMAAGLPLISTELGTGTSWVNQPGETGLVVPPNDPHALAVAIHELLNDQARWARFSANARQRAAQFDVGAMVRGVEAIYRDVLEQ